MTFIEAIENYNSYLVVEKGLTENSVTAYISDIHRFSRLCSAHGVHTPEDVNEGILKEYISDINNSGMSTRSQARFISTFHSFFKYLKDEHYIEDIPVKGVDKPKITSSNPTILTVEEIDKIKDSVEKYKPENWRNRAIVEMLYSCGLRVSEVLRLNISNIDMNRNIVRIDDKGNRFRTLELKDRAKKDIKQYLNNYRNYLTVQLGYEDVLFLNKKGQPLSRVTVFNIVRGLVQKTGINKKISPHTFRHSFTDHMIKKGTELYKVQEMLGNKTIVSTILYAKN